MAILSVENKLGYIEVEGGGRKLANEATAEDVEYLVRAIMERESVVLDPVGEMVNPANRIVYEQLHSALSALVDRKPDILSEVSSRFSAAEKKYLMRRMICGRYKGPRVSCRTVEGHYPRHSPFYLSVLRCGL